MGEGKWTAQRREKRKQRKQLEQDWEKFLEDEREYGKKNSK